MSINQDRIDATGLCMTCNHASFCVFLARAESTIWSCEEFDDRPPVNSIDPITQTNETMGIDERVLETPQRKAS